MTEEQIWLISSVEVKSGISTVDFNKSVKYSSLLHNNMRASKVQIGQRL